MANEDKPLTREERVRLREKRLRASPRSPAFSSGGICAYCGAIVGPDPEAQRRHEDEKGCQRYHLDADRDRMDYIE